MTLMHYLYGHLRDKKEFSTKRIKQMTNLTSAACAKLLLQSKNDSLDSEGRIQCSPLSIDFSKNTRVVFIFLPPVDFLLNQD